MSPMIQVSTTHRALILPPRNDVLNLIPHTKRLSDGRMVVPHGYAETRLLQNLGLPVPAPILHHYDWAGGKPFESQRQTAALLTTNPRAYVLNGMGTGKTKSALWAFDWLRSQRQAQRMLVVAPLSTLTFTWLREAFSTVPHLKVGVLHGSREKRLRLLSEQHDVYVVNHDGLEIIEPALRERPDIDVICIDELATYRNGRSRRSKVAAKVLKGRNWGWGMTGSPTPKEPTDAFGQVRLLTPGNLDGQAFTRFREQVMRKVTNWKWVAKDDATETVHRLMQPAVRYTLDDVVELPEMVPLPVEVPLGPKQAEVYAKLEEHSFSLVDNGTVVAMNEGACRVKLMQVACGWVYTNQKGITRLDPEPRIDALLDVLESGIGKTIVFVPFTHALNGVAEEVAKAGYSLEVIDGSTAAGRRNKAFDRFQNGTDLDVLVAHPQTMAHGLTLTAADTIVWFAPTEDLEIFDQANARIRRVGQKRKQRLVMLQGTAIERRAYRRLQTKQNMQGLLLEMYEEQTRRKKT